MTQPLCVSMSPEMFERLIWVAVVVALLVVERWLGITDKVKAASILESVENVVLKKALPDEPAVNQEKKDVEGV